ncbi:uncharacterized protein LOC116805326 isoform X1 [Drosophila grimshawi]|uniref:uncharacterized protein LOC116805326 isoform X1 n=1 Tax=Drosophila grimshawi TaxID=7222 RepID=UPI0013EF3CF2|nr:uncharacterized protein LOC116805326 isoform X1 [Drosophila grimshawi]
MVQVQRGCRAKRRVQHRHRDKDRDWERQQRQTGNRETVQGRAFAFRRFWPVCVATRCAQKVQQKEILLFIEPGRTPLHKGKTNFTTIVNGEKMWNTHGSHISQYQIIIK